MNDYLIEKARQRAYQDTKDIVSIEPIAIPRTLDDVRSERLIERGFEKMAPKTGFARLDKIVHGFIPGHVYVVTGETNVGKTKLGVNFALQVAYQLKRVLYVALEPENMILEYIASAFHNKEFSKLDEEDIELEGLKIDIYGKKEIDSLDRLIESIGLLDRYDLIVIDHIGYFVTSQTNQVQEQSNAMKLLVGLAQGKGSAIMLIAHLRKKPVGKKAYSPVADDISGSGAFSRDATEVFIVTRDSIISGEGDTLYLDTGFLHVVKTKRGDNAKIPLRFGTGNAIITEGLTGNS